MRPGGVVSITGIVVPSTIHVDVVGVAVGTLGMSEVSPVMSCRVKRGEKYVTEMEVLARIEPLMPRK